MGQPPGTWPWREALASPCPGRPGNPAAGSEGASWGAARHPPRPTGPGPLQPPVAGMQSLWPLLECSLPPDRPAVDPRRSHAPDGEGEAGEPLPALGRGLTVAAVGGDICVVGVTVREPRGSGWGCRAWRSLAPGPGPGVGAARAGPEPGDTGLPPLPSASPRPLRAPQVRQPP